MGVYSIGVPRSELTIVNSAYYLLNNCYMLAIKALCTISNKMLNGVTTPVFRGRNTELTDVKQLFRT
jgi:hypothetical protein